MNPPALDIGLRRLCGESSDRQWNDILGIVRMRAGALDEEYLRRWSVELGVEDLLRRLLSGPGRTSTLLA